MTTFLYNIIPALCQLIITFTIIWNVHYVIGLLFLVCMVWYLWYGMRINIAVLPDIRKIKKQSIKNAKILSESYQEVTLYKTNGRENFAIEKIERGYNKIERESESAWMPFFIRATILRFTSGLFRWAAIIIALYYVYANMVTLGGFFLVVSLFSENSDD